MGNAGREKPGPSTIPTDQTPDELRYGLLVPNAQLCRWQESAIKALDDIAGVSACVIVVDPRTTSNPVRTSKLRNPGGALWATFDQRSRKRTPALKPVDMTDRFSRVPTIQASVDEKHSWEEFSETDLEAIAATRPDFLLRFGFGQIRGRILEVAPLGVWSFHHGDEQIHRGGPPCFWECYHGDDTTGVVLERLTDRADHAMPLAKAWFRTIKHSVASNRHQAYMGAAPLPAQTARRVLAGVHDLTEGLPASSTAPIRAAPSNSQMVRFVARATTRSVRLQVRGITRTDRWHVGVVPRPISEVAMGSTVTDVIWFPRLPQSTRYIADPFGCPTANGDYCVLVEDLDHTDGHGVVASYRVAPDGKVRSGPSPVRKFPTHVSYPSLVRVGEEWWMVPESARANDVTAYRFDPDAATVAGVAATLMKGLALRDPTLFEWQGLWWLFATDGAMGSNTHLRAWWAESPPGPWQQHAIDPLCIDVRSARGAGSPFEIDGVLYRPGQDNSVSYGGALTVKRVLELTPDRFREEWVSTLVTEPDSPFPDGLHTLNRLGDHLTLIDAVEHRFDRAYARRMLRKRLSRFLSTSVDQ